MISGSIDLDKGSEESSSMHKGMVNNFKSALDEFREKWQHELTVDLLGEENVSHSKNGTNNKLEDIHIFNKESKAEELFLQGVEYERRGKVYDALSFYRRAVQIVPDIESRIFDSTKANMLIQSTESSYFSVPQYDEEPNDNCSTTFNESDEDLNNVDLILRFQTSLLKNSDFIEKSNCEKEKNTSGTHISNLPMELILYLLRWIVSSHLDMKSLEACSAVCKGFYICARDEDIWRLACLKVWGLNTGMLQNSLHSSWREMFMQRNRVHFNGCYISKTSYLRYGENSFQDQFYRPMQLIEYYRYLRFLPGGTVAMMTSTDDPGQSIIKLKNFNHLRPEILKGHYRLHGDLVIIVLKKNQRAYAVGNQKRRIECEGNNSLNTFYIELKIVSNAKKRFCQLQWKHYSAIQENKREISTEFELTSAKYPALWFSRVKSYNLESEGPLK